MWRVTYCVVAFVLFFIGNDFDKSNIIFFVSSIAVGFAIEFFTIRKRHSTSLLAAVIGGMLTAISYILVMAVLDRMGLNLGFAKSFAIFVFISYIAIGSSFAIVPNLATILKVKESESSKNAKILDTSVIVDGRVYDIAEKKFFDGLLILPEFVIKEVQFLSDSRDPQKRIRGRRALEILNKMKTSKNIYLSITDIDFPNIKEVDMKLIELAKKMNAKIITNDFNLIKVASIHNVDTLSINNLANSLSVVVLPGEVIEVDLVREGKDKQALAYFEDGTMIVVDNAKHLIGKTVRIEIDAVLPKEAGRVIFAYLEGAKPQGRK